MEITSLSSSFADLTHDLVIIGVTPSELSAPKALRSKRSVAGFSIAALDQAEQGRLGAEITRLEFKASVGTQLVFHARTLPNIGWIVLVGLGELSKKAHVRAEQLRVFGAAVRATAEQHKAHSPTVIVAQMQTKDLDAVRALVEGVVLGGYRFAAYKKKKKDEREFRLEDLSIALESVIDKRAVQLGQHDSHATNMARDLVNLPPNDCTPTTLVAKAKEIARDAKYQIDVYDRAALKKMGAGSLLAVAHGSEEPPYLIRMVKPSKKKNARKIAIVGKGVTFDSGGLSIKPAQSMEEMKSDMAGAAAVFGAMLAIADDKLDVEVRCYVPTVENMINGKATRPGDIVRAMNGTTIEILNTDAEGRLILADAICLAEKDGCEVIVDLATLTGACVVALGLEYTGLFATDDRLANELSKAADAAGEKLWRLPLAPEYRKLMDSPVADIKNSGPRWGGAILAAIFIREFITSPKTAWAHLDIAGPSYAESDKGYIKKGGTGVGVRTLARWLREL